MAREILVYGVTCGIYAVPAGASLAVLVKPAPGEITSVVKYASGGSLEIIGCAGPGLTGVPVAGTGYLFGTAEAVATDGPAYYYLVATGSTAVAYFKKGLSQGF